MPTSTSSPGAPFSSRAEESDSAQERIVAAPTETATLANRALQQEIEERGKVEAQLRAESARTEMLLNSIPDRFFGIDANWRYSYFNRHAEEQLRLLGKNPASMIGKVLWDEFPKPDLEPELRRSMTERVAVTHEYYFEPLGEWLHTRIYPSPDGGLAVFQNCVTERKRAEEQLRQAHKELARVSRVLTVGEIASSIAHELVQPLAAIVTHGAASIRWLRRDPPDLDEAEVAVGQMVRNAGRASDVLKALRALVDKKQPSQPEPVRINAIIGQAIVFTNDELSQHRISLQLSLGTDLPAVLGDRTQLEQVLLNLIMNSKEAMASVDVRRLVISSGMTSRGEVIVAIRDSGIGLPLNDAERMFAAFYTTKESGLGLGLSISRTIIEAHGGRLTATTNEDGGATFNVILPAVAA